MEDPSISVFSLFPAPATTTEADVTQEANPSSIQEPQLSHPPYPEMISAAITALNEKNGSSRQAIAKYIERVYPNLPATHSALLTHHLRRLKSDGQLFMVNRSYNLHPPRSDDNPSFINNNNNNNNNNAAAAPPPAVPKKRGRQPKPKPIPTGPNVTNGPSKKRPGRPKRVVVESSGMIGNINEQGGQFDATKLEVVIEGAKRKRGRPAKSKSVSMGQDGFKIKKKPGRKPKVQDQAQTQPVPVVIPYENVELPPKHRGRPKRDVNVQEKTPLHPGGGVVGKKRGRPSLKSGPDKKPVRSKGKPNKGNAADMTGPVVPQWMVDYYQVQAKLTYVQSRMANAVGVLRPHLIVQGMVNDEVLAAVKELDEITTMDILRAQLNVPALDAGAQPANIYSLVPCSSTIPNEQQPILG